MPHRWISPPTPTNEQWRVAALRRHRILDSEAEQSFDDLVLLASTICGAPISLLSFVDSERQWFKAAIGLEVKETPRDVSFCAHAIDQESLFVVEDAAQDERFATNPLVVEAPAIRFYAGTPLRTEDGLALGTLCVIDRQPRVLNASQRAALQALGRQAEAQLRLRLARAELEAKNAELLELARQKSLLASLVVHDLKSPLSAILPNAGYLARESPSAQAREAAGDIENAARQMGRLVLDILDIERSNGVLPVRLESCDVLAVVGDLSAASTGRLAASGHTVQLELEGSPSLLETDAHLLRRVLENLLDNALKYAPPSTVVVHVRYLRSSVEVIVADMAPMIPPESRTAVFAKYTRLEGDAGNSRGLGLAFCKMAVERLGGRIWVEPNEPRGNRLVVSLPSSASQPVGAHSELPAASAARAARV